MKKILIFSIALGVGAAATYLLIGSNGQSQVLEAQLANTTIKEELLGYTKYSDYIAAGKLALKEHTIFLAAKVVREYDLVEHLETSKLGLTSTATVIVSYATEYSFGFELDDFDIRSTQAGILIRVRAPVMVAAPAVTPMRYEILDRGFLTDEKVAVIEIQQRLPVIARRRGRSMAQEEMIRAACDKRLADFLRGFLAKQPGVTRVPQILVAYK